MAYRTYDRHWNRTGYAAGPQYPGQADLAYDTPAKCHCGAGIVAVSGMGSFLGRPEADSAKCANGHFLAAEMV